MEYIESGYIEAGYFETSIVGIQGEAALVASFAIAAELLDISDGANAYLDSTYVTPGYFEYVEQNTLEASLNVFATIVTNGEIIIEAQATLYGATAVVAVASKNVEINLAVISTGGMTTAANKYHGIIENIATQTSQTINAGKLIPGSAGIVSNDYVDSDYIVALYFAGVLTGGLISAFTQTAVVGKIQQGVIGNLTNDYVDSTYLEGGYFFGVSDVILTATLVGDLTLSETGFINGSAILSSQFSLTAIPLELTAPQEAYASLMSATAVVAVATPIYSTDANVSSSFISSTEATKAHGFSSNISADFASSSDAQRTRGIEAAFVEQTNLTTINSRIRDTNTQMSSEFSQVTYGARQRDIDLFAFSDAALAAQAVVIRDSNTLANTFFNIGTDFIRQRDNYADADAETSTSTTSIRIRDTNIETQDAFSFGSSAVKTTDITHSFVDTFLLPNVQYAVTKETPVSIENTFTVNIAIDIFRGFDSQQQVDVQVQLIPNVTREMGSDITSQITFVGQGNATLDCDMVAFDDANTTIIANARFRANSEMFSIPGFNLVANNTRVRRHSSTQIAVSQTQTQAMKLNGFIADVFASAGSVSALGGRVNPLYSQMTDTITLSAAGVVRFYFFPTEFSVQVADEPLADTLFSRTRETGVNI